jgi:hypothetical protein
VNIHSVGGALERGGEKGRLSAMSSQPNPDSVEVPPVSPEERAEWDAVKARVAEGDESGLVAWDDLAAELGL